MIVFPVFGILSLCLGFTASAVPLDSPQAILNDAASSAEPDSLDISSRPSWFTSTLMARRLLALSPSGVISTVFPDSIPPSAHTPSSVAGFPIGLREYISDCDGALPSDLTHDDNGDPTILALRVATTFKNIAAGSNFSLELDWWDHLDAAAPVYPSLPLSPAALPRVTLFGYLETLPSLSEAASASLEQCFLASHSDAKVWLPGAPGSPHASFWARMVVNQAYWIGGFGDVQQIGWINMTEWKGIRRHYSLANVGDGRGWEDVRLPGEKP
ncbi:FMN-binding split barrel-like protein [Penicillium capsulatum]|uniref:FMN-binding split barrel-like protein n=1 Tax=Penicillium capsulatum TaxID=69766 RepID=A0A9W9IN73_9EURO|nr:FMN-binding split barrel-like protein [Penicillium capsulatum]KAJ6122203.1 FMN-binding split barrel-like protein [Penicillium capsulatum]